MTQGLPGSAKEKPIQAKHLQGHKDIGTNVVLRDHSKYTDKKLHQCYNNIICLNKMKIFAREIRG